jgi:hypothetical protein
MRSSAVMLSVAVALFSAVLLVSRVVDLGVMDPRAFVVDGTERRTAIGVEVKRERGGLVITYSPTRYPYLWVVGLKEGRSVSPIVPRVVTSTAPYGHRTHHLGERIVATPALEPPYVVLTVFSPVPRRLEEIERFIADTRQSDPKAAALAMQMPGSRYVNVIGAAP